MNIFLLPATTENFNVSIRSSVRRELFERHLDAEITAKLKSHIGDVTRVNCWAFRRGPRSSSLYKRMAPGDIVLFREKGSALMEYMAEVGFKVKSESLGRAIWPIQGSEPWENIFILCNVKKLNILFDRFKSLLGYDRDFVLEGPITVTPDRLSKIPKQYGSFVDFINAVGRGRLPSRQIILRKASKE